MFLTKVIDPAGNAVTLNYDDRLRLKSFTDATDRRTTFQYALADKPLLITAVTDPFGRRAKLAYDTSGRLIRITDVLGMASEFTYDAGTQITAMTTPYGTTSFAASGDGNARRIEITDPLGAKEVVVYGHNTPGMPDAESVVPSGLTAPVANAYLSYRNTAYWNKQAQAQAPGDYTQARIKHWTHAPDGLKTWYTLESIKQPLERRVWFSYPGQESNLWRSTLMAGSFDQPSALARVLDDGSTQLIRYDYNAKGQVTRAIDPMGRQTRYSYADNGIDLLRVTQVTAAGEETLAEVTWNAQHRPLSVRDAAGQVTQYTYNAAGQVVSVTDALGQMTAFSYDAVGQLTRIVNPAGRTALAFSYDGFGRVASRTDSEGYTVTYGYDALDRVTTVGYPDGSRERYAYNKLDPVSFTDRLGRRTVSVYDAVRNRIAVTDPSGHTVRYGYDADGRLKSLTDARGNTTRFERDIQGRLTARVYADGSREGYAYDAAAGRLSTRTDALGQRTAYGYARDNRLAAVDYAGALEETASVRFEDDPSFPRRVRMSDGAGTTTYQYYPAGGPGALQLAQEDGPFDEDTVSYGYDALGRVTSRQVADRSEAWAYDVLGRVIGHQNPLGTFSYAYLGDSDQVTAELLDEVPLATWRYLDNAGDRRLAAIAYPNGLTNATLRSDPYRILGIAEASRVRAYRYDAKDRLVLAVDLSRAEDQTRLAQARATRGVVYRYDAADNLLQGLTLPGQVNALNQLLRWEGQALDYDANGNLIADGRWRYRYDAENRLVAIQPQEISSELEYRFGYDGLGRRVSESGNDSLRSLTWCGEEICQFRS
ncbi:MAG: hypothetical protein WBV64_11840, partial [Mycobacterium sp.]